MKKISTILAVLFFITTVVFSALYFSKSDETVPSNSDEQLQENKNDVKVTDSEPEQDSEPDQQKGESETVVPDSQNNQKENEIDATSQGETPWVEELLGERTDLYEYSLDLEYERELALAKSNVEIGNVNDKYAKKWEEKALEYLQAIENYPIESSREEHKVIAELFKKNQAEWEEYYEKQVEFFEEIMLLEYSTGSIVGVLETDYYRKLNRDRALELYHCCNALFLVEVEKP